MFAQWRLLLFFHAAQVLFLDSVGGQMSQPLLGQGKPPAFLPGSDENLSWLLNDTFLASSPSPDMRINVYVSAFLDKLLKVNDQDYNFEAVLFVRLSWVDSRARGEIFRRTNETYGAGNGPACRRECHTNYQQCCDSLWLPGFDLINAWGLPEERVDYEAITTNPRNHSVVGWIKRFSGIFYTPMNFRRFPFDTQVLVIDLWTQVFGHRLIPSSSGTQVTSDSKQTGTYSDLSSWKVSSVKLEVYAFNIPVMTKHFSPPDPSDPWPLDVFAEDLIATYDRVTPDCLRIKINIRRLSGYYIASFILPVVLCVVLSWWTFWISPQQIETRMGILISLFLALTALQFTISNQLPASTYMTVMGWILIVSYLTIGLGTVETVLVYCIFRWYINRVDGDAREKDGAVSLASPSRRAESTPSVGSGEDVQGEVREGFEKGHGDEVRMGERGPLTGTAVKESFAGSPPQGERWRGHVGLMASSLARMKRSMSLMAITRALSQVSRVDSDLRSNMSKAKEVISRIERLSSWTLPFMYALSLSVVIGAVGRG